LDFLVYCFQFKLENVVLFFSKTPFLILIFFLFVQ
jgi:hypothetical protein